MPRGTTSATRSSSASHAPCQVSCAGGDLLAPHRRRRVVAVVSGTDDADARRVIERIEEAVSRINAQGVRASISIGSACCGKNGDADRTRQLADEAM